MGLICVRFNYGSGGAKFDRRIIDSVLLRSHVCVNLHLKCKAAPSLGMVSSLCASTSNQGGCWARLRGP